MCIGVIAIVLLNRDFWNVSEKNKKFLFFKPEFNNIFFCILF